MTSLAVLVVLSVCFVTCGTAFVPFNSNSATRSQQTSLFIFDKVGEMFSELDAFMDDATSRRLGAGAQFYGKRKSGFYGADDKGRKKDKSVPDPLGKLVAINVIIYEAMHEILRF